MALTDYERYQLEWMIDHGHGLAELVDELTGLQNDLEEKPGVNLSVRDVFDAWVTECGFGGECFACEAEWRDAEGRAPANPHPQHGITKDMVRDGIEHGVIRFEENPDPNDPWKTVCAIGNHDFYFADTTDIPVSEYIRMNQNNLDMVVDDVWEALNGDILRDFSDDYERYASMLSEPHESGTSSLSMPGKQAVGCAYTFNLFSPDTLASSGVALKETGTVVTVDGKDYPLMKGASYEDSRAVDALLDSHGEKRIRDYEKLPQGVSLKQAAREARSASDALTERKTADDPGGKDERERFWQNR